MVKAAMRLSTDKRTILVIIFGFLFILSLNFFQKEVKGFFYFFSSPIQQIFWQSGNDVSDFFESVLGAGNIKKNNEELNLKVQELFLLQNLADELKKENEMLREALELGIDKEYRLELAEIIGKDSDKDMLLIDKGSEDGILSGFPIITSQKVLIGAVEEVYQNNSKVLLISDKESQLQAKISGTGIAGLLKGLGSGRILLDIIPIEEKIQAGDLVVSGDFLVGLIKDVKKIDADIFQRAEISPFYKISDLDKLFVVLD